MNEDKCRKGFEEEYGTWGDSVVFDKKTDCYKIKTNNRMDCSLMAGVREYNIQWEAWQASCTFFASTTVEPWDMVPDESCGAMDTRRKLVVNQNGEFWVWPGDESKFFDNCFNFPPLVHGYNCEPSRDGEFRAWGEQECDAPECCHGNCCLDPGQNEIEARWGKCTKCQGTGKIGRWEEKNEQR